MLLLPESPRWLLSQGYIEEGQTVVAALADSPYESEQTVLETRVIRETLAGIESEQKIRDLFTNGKTQHFRRTLLGAVSQFFQQVGGSYQDTDRENYLIESALSLFQGAMRLFILHL